MMSAGKLSERVAFYRATATGGFGDTSDGFADAPYCERWCQYVPQTGRERIEAGRDEASTLGVIRLRKDSTTETISAADKAVINGVPHRIVSKPISRGQRDRMIELEVDQRDFV